MLSNVSLHCLNEIKVMVVKDTERENVDFICRKTGTKLVDHFDQFTADMLGSTKLVEEASLSGSGKLFKIISADCTSPDKTVVIVVLVLTNW